MHPDIKFYLSEEKGLDSDGMQSAGVTNFFRFFKLFWFKGIFTKIKG